MHICLCVSIHICVRMFGFLNLYILNGMFVVHTCPFITRLCEEGLCVCGLCVLGYYFPVPVSVSMSAPPCV